MLWSSLDMQSPLEKNVLLFPELWILSGAGP